MYHQIAPSSLRMHCRRSIRAAVFSTTLSVVLLEYRIRRPSKQGQSRLNLRGSMVVEYFLCDCSTIAALLPPTPYYIPHPVILNCCAGLLWHLHHTWIIAQSHNV